MNQNLSNNSFDIILNIGKYLYKENWPKVLHSFLSKYGGLYLYDIDMNNRYKIDDWYIRLVKKYVYALIGKPDHPYGT